MRRAGLAGVALVAVAGAGLLSACALPGPGGAGGSTTATAGATPSTEAARSTGTVPSTVPSTGTVPPVVRAATHSHEVPTPAGPPGAVSAPALGPADAVRSFATRFINWNPQTVTGVMNGLARASLGQARAAMTLAAAQVAGTDEIVQNGIANAGTVEAVAPLRDGNGRFVVITRERTTATLTNAYDGLRPAWHVTVATVTRLPGGGWAVSGWQPEN